LKEKHNKVKNMGDVGHLGKASTYLLALPFPLFYCCHFFLLNPCFVIRFFLFHLLLQWKKRQYNPTFDGDSWI
jgi:hypothetical protein